MAPLNGVVSQILLAVSDTFGLLLVAKATLVLVTSLGAAAVLRRRSGALRHLVHASAFGVLLCLPFASSVVPTVAIELPEVSATMPATSPRLMPVSVPHVEPNAAIEPQSVAAPERWLSMRQALILAWLAGAVLFVVPVVGGFRQLRRLIVTADRSPDTQALAQSLAVAAGIGQTVTVLQHKSLSGPITCGFFSPRIMLPLGPEWDSDAVRRALIHELEHVRRGDWLTHILARVVCSLYWFHPLAWVVRRRLVLDAERACDDAVVQREDPTAYAALLVRVARRGASAVRQPMLAMAHHEDLSLRISAVLDNRQRRGRVRLGVVLTAVGMTIALVCLLGALTVVQARSTDESISSERVSAGTIETTEAVKTSAPTLTPSVESAPPSTKPRAVPMPVRAALVERRDSLTQIASTREFDVASVKANTSGETGTRVGFSPDGGFTATSITLRDLILTAYGTPAPLMSSRLVGGPDWIGSSRFDVVAKAGGPAVPADLLLMLRSLLAERFGLMLHAETRELQTFALVIDRADARLGPGLRRSDLDCAAARRNGPPAPQPDGRPTCAMRGAPGRLIGGSVSMGQLAASLSTRLNAIVSDMTGLAGVFDVDLEFTPPQPAAAPPDPAGSAAANAPSIFAGIQEQLGLRLDSKKAPVEVMVVDRAEMPTPN